MTTHRLPLLVLAAATVVACDRSRPELERTVAEVQELSAQKDSLLSDVLATTQFVSELSTELNRVKRIDAGKPVEGLPSELEGKSPREQRAAILARVQELTARLAESEQRLAASRARVQRLTGSNTDLERQLAQYDSTIGALRVVIESQKTEIAALGEQVAGLQQQTVALAAEKDTLVQTVATVAAERDRAFYIIGTEDFLVKSGVLVKRGGVMGMGRSLLPAVTLDEGKFTAIDRLRDSVIAFPDAAKAYRIVTRQDPNGLEVLPGKDGRIKGGLKIKSPEQFWAASRYLIIVEQ
jgi:FtsZ-binding cell division protein ZapB/outer membrane murein-binding lipoprotein Lpp